MERLPDWLSARVLQRASEIDASGESGTSIAELRHAALTAGISEHAFDRALAEVHQRPVDQSEAVKQPARAGHRRRRLGGIVTGLIVVPLSLAFLLRSQWVPHQVGDAGMVDETIELGCLAQRDAGMLLRPLLPKGKSTMAWSEQEPRELRVHSTAAQIRLMREKVAEVERHAVYCVNLSLRLAHASQSPDLEFSRSPRRDAGVFGNACTGARAHRLSGSWSSVRSFSGRVFQRVA